MFTNYTYTNPADAKRARDNMLVYTDYAKDIANQYLNPEANKYDSSSILAPTFNTQGYQSAVNTLQPYGATQPLNYNPTQQQDSISAAYGHALNAYQQAISPDAQQGQLLNDQYSRAQDLLKPYTDLGTNSANQLGNLSGANGAQAQKDAYNQILQSQVVQGPLQLGLQGVAGTKAAQGLLGSGNLLTALNDYGINTAMPAISNYTNQLLNQANLGQQAGNTLNQSAASQAAAQNALAQTHMGQGSTIAGLYSSQNAAQVAAQQQSQAQQSQAQALGLQGAGTLAQAQAGLNTGQTAQAQQAYQNALSQYNQQFQTQYNVNQGYAQPMMQMDLGLGSYFANSFTNEGQRVGTLNNMTGEGTGPSANNSNSGGGSSLGALGGAIGGDIALSILGEAGFL